MIDLDCDLQGASLALDASDGSFEIAVAGRRHRLREWTWAERRRLAMTSLQGGHFDGARFVRATLDLLVSPPPSEDVAPIVAHLALAALGVGRAAEQQQPLTFAEAELRLARELAWPPAEVGRQAAGDVDRILAALALPQTPAVPAAHAHQASAAGQPPPGWNRIVVERDDQ